MIDFKELESLFSTKAVPIKGMLICLRDLHFFLNFKLLTQRLSDDLFQVKKKGFTDINILLASLEHRSTFIVCTMEK